MDDPDGVVRLFVEIVRGPPSLPGAACRGGHELFDEVPGRDPERHVQQRQRLEMAAGLCRTLPGPARVPAVDV